MDLSEYEDFLSGCTSISRLWFPRFSQCRYLRIRETTYTKFATGVAGLGVVTGVGLKAAGVLSVAHSSGAAIVSTTSWGYLAGTIGRLPHIQDSTLAPGSVTSMR